MAHPVARAAGRSLLATLATIVLVPIVAAVLLGVPIGLAALAPVDDDLRIVVWGVGVVFFLFTFAGGAIAFAIFRTNVLDPSFAAIGLHGRSLFPNVREWKGLVGSRLVYATYARRGGVLELALEEDVGARASFTADATVGRVRELVGLTPLDRPSDPRLAGLVMAGSDVAWTQALIARPGVADALQRLLADPSGRELRWVLVRPGCVKITRRWIDPDAAGASLEEQLRALELIAGACVQVGRPAQRLTESAIERTFRRSPSGASLALVLGLLTFLLLPAVAITFGVLLLSVR